MDTSEVLITLNWPKALTDAVEADARLFGINTSEYLKAAATAALLRNGAVRIIDVDLDSVQVRPVTEIN